MIRPILDGGNAPRFLAAQPGWLRGRKREKNLLVGFRTVSARPRDGEARLKIAAASLYRLFVNGIFVGHGPARGPRNLPPECGGHLHGLSGAGARRGGEGSLPTPDGFIHIAWNRTAGKLNHMVQAPAGYRTYLV